MYFSLFETSAISFMFALADRMGVAKLAWAWTDRRNALVSAASWLLSCSKVVSC
jgi:hypothetical protein